MSVKIGSIVFQSRCVLAMHAKRLLAACEIEQRHTSTMPRKRNPYLVISCASITAC